METALFFLPSMLCLLFGVQYFFRKKNRTQRYMMYLLFTGAFYFFTYAFYISPKTDYLWLCRLDSVNEPLLLTCIAMFIAYIQMHISGAKYGEKRKKNQNKKMRKFLQTLIVPVVAIGTINLLLYYIIGFETAAEMMQKGDEMGKKIASPEIITLFKDRIEPSMTKLFGLFNQTIFNIMSIVYAIFLIVSCVYCARTNGSRFGAMFRFFCRGKESSPARAGAVCTLMLVASMSPLLILGRGYFVNNMWAGVIMTMFISISLFLLTNAEMMSQRKHFTVHDIVTSSLAESGIPIHVDNDTDSDFDTDSDTDSQNSPFGGRGASFGGRGAVIGAGLGAVRTKHIIDKMQAAFEEDKVYTNTELTVGVMAELIGTNRTTLSNIINQQYGITFRDLVNRYRIEAAKAYITDRPTATQEEVAVACGFRSASALNHKFKEIVGLPPTLWLTTKDLPPAPPKEG